MSNSFNQPMPGYKPPGMQVRPPEPSNGMGVAGFIISLVSLVICGIPAIVGLIVSLLALRKEPRGFAVAGAIISFVALIEMVFVGMMMYSTFKLVDEFSGEIQNEISRQVMSRKAGDVADKWEEDGAVPSYTEGQEMLDGSTDVFDNQILYETDGESFSIRSIGEDGQPMTEDDIVIGPFESFEDAKDLPAEFGNFPGGSEFQKIQEEIEAEMEKAKAEAKQSLEEAQNDLDDLK